MAKIQSPTQSLRPEKYRSKLSIQSKTRMPNDFLYLKHIVGCTVHSIYIIFTQIIADGVFSKYKTYMFF